MANTVIYRDSVSTGHNKFTFSAWVKRSKISSPQSILGMYNNNDQRGKIRFDHNNGDDELYVWLKNAVGTEFSFHTNAKYRDVNGWYHVVVTIDTTQSTASDRCKVYINGEQVSGTYYGQDIVQNSTTMIFGHSKHSIGTSYYNGSWESQYFDGSMSHVHCCYGYAYQASDFGETDSTTGEWKIKTEPSVSYGSNGFFILKDGNSTTDQSGNNISLTTNGTLTKTEDSPSNVFATLNPLHMDDPTANYFLSNGNLRQNVTNNDGHRETGFTLHPKGLKGYFEVKCTVDPNFHLGLQNVTSPLVKTNYYTLASPNYYYMQASNPVKISYANSGSSATHIADYFSQISTGDIIGCAFDFTGTNKNVWFHKNGTYGNNGSGVGNPATGAYPAMTSTQLTADEYEFIVSPNTGSGNGQLDFNFGNGYFGTTAVASAGTNASGIGIFEYDVPTGYTALSTKGLNL